MCSFKKQFPYPPHRRSLKITRGGGGGLKGQNFKKKSEAKWNFQRGRGGGFKPNNLTQ